MRSLSLVLCQFRPTKGQPQDNLDRIEKVLGDLAAAGNAPDILIFPETILTGYFLEGGVRELAYTSEELFRELQFRHEKSGAAEIDLCLGFYETRNDRLHNAAIWVTLGGQKPGIRHVHRKVFLPTYGVFDEDRFVEAGRDVQAFDTRFGRMAMLVCEDAWHSMIPMIAAVDGAQLIAVVAASPARGLTPDPLYPGQPESLARWQRLAQGISAEHGVYVAMAQLVGFEGGKGFPGGSLIAAPDGRVLCKAPLFEDAVLSERIDLDEISRVRAQSPLLADMELQLPHLIEALGRVRLGRHRPGLAEHNDGDNGVAGHVEVAASGDTVSPPKPDLTIDPELTVRWLVEFLRDEVGRRRGFDKVIVGLSGGVDSAVVAFLAVKALGNDRVVAVRMPYRTSNSDSLDHAHLVATKLGIEERTVDISAAVDGYAAECGVRPTPARLGNVMARIRMTTLFDLSAAFKALPLGTGNKSERLLGYFTWHADDSPPINPIGDLFKTQVWQLARHLGVPDVIVSKPASADLIANQTDEADFGISYHRADEILDLIVRGYALPQLLKAGYQSDEIALVTHRLDGTHWKRRLPSTAMLSQTAIGEYYLRPVDY